MRFLQNNSQQNALLSSTSLRLRILLTLMLKARETSLGSLIIQFGEKRATCFFTLLYGVAFFLQKKEKK